MNLLTAQEVMNILRCKKSKFYAVHAPHIRPVQSGGVRLYDAIDVEYYVENVLKGEIQCQSQKEQGHPIINMTLPSKAGGFEAALKRTTAKLHAVSRQS